ncbi:MAG: hypothetical protein JWN52_6616 [Actinomycetia bacterium]|nr:hypothetical protein [Actinomycetes bacterium]
MTRTALYRFYDASDVLLYVGITDNPRQRWLAHKSQKSWWQDVADKAVEWHEDRESAERAERIAIGREKPLYNIQNAGGLRRRIDPAEITGFWRYVERVSNGASATEIAGKIGGGIAQSTVSRWKETAPKIQSVVALAKVYGQDPLDALVVAGFLTENDRHEPTTINVPVDLSGFTSDQLVAELARRMKR